MRLLKKAAGREKSAPQFHFHGFSLFTDRYVPEIAEQ